MPKKGMGAVAKHDVYLKLSLSSSLVISRLTITYFSVAQLFISYNTEHARDFAMPVNNWNDWTIKIDVRIDQKVDRFVFKICFGETSYIVTDLWVSPWKYWI